MNEQSIEWFSYFDITPDLVCIAGKDGYFRKVNRSVIQKLGYTEEELFESPISHFIHPDDKSITAEKRAKLIQGEHLVNYENRYLSKSGQTIWLHWTSLYLTDKEMVFAMARDVSGRKMAELELEEKYKKFEVLATHFKSSIEKDRKYFAYELQEQIAQLAAVIKMDLSTVSDSMTAIPDKSRLKIDHALAASDLLLKTIQRLSFKISPKMLFEFGLYDTLNWLCKEFTILNGIPCRFNASISEDLLTAEMKTDFFRICQEALTNVIRHADAGNVNLQIDRDGEKIQLTVTDNGKGFEVQNLKAGYGLTHLRELATSLNGALEIKSAPGKGTMIIVRI